MVVLSTHLAVCFGFSQSEIAGLVDMAENDSHGDCNGTLDSLFCVGWR